MKICQVKHLEYIRCSSGAQAVQSPNKPVVQSLSCVLLFVTPWTAACQATLSFTTSCSLLKLISVESVMPSNHLILCHPLFLLPSVFRSIRVFFNESALWVRWPEYWSFRLKKLYSFWVLDQLMQILLLNMISKYWVMKNKVKALCHYSLLLIAKFNNQEPFFPTKMFQTGYNIRGKSFQVLDNGLNCLMSMSEYLFHILCLAFNCFRWDDKSSPCYFTVAGHGRLAVVCHELKMHVLW